MKKLAFLVFMFAIAFVSIQAISTNNNEKLPEFPAYSSDLTHAFGSCGCTGAFTSCDQSCDGSNCTCSCGAFSCSCTECKQLSPAIGEISISLVQFKKWEALASLLKSDKAAKDAYLIFYNMINKLKVKEYAAYKHLVTEFTAELKTLPTTSRVKLNDYFSSIKSDFRI